MGHRTTLKSIDRLNDKKKLKEIWDKYKKLIRIRGLPAETRRLAHNIIERAEDRAEYIEGLEEEPEEQEKEKEKEKS